MVIITLFLSQSSDKNLIGKKKSQQFCNGLELNSIGFVALKDEFKSITGKWLWFNSQNLLLENDYNSTRKNISFIWMVTTLFIYFCTLFDPSNDPSSLVFLMLKIEQTQVDEHLVHQLACSSVRIGDDRVTTHLEYYVRRISVAAVMRKSCP